MLRLYDGAQTGGVVAQAILAWTGEPFELIRVDLAGGAHKAAPYLALNPRGQVPALVLDDGEVVTETVAIALVLAARRPASGLMPPADSKPMRQTLRWLLFLATNLYEGENRKVNPNRFATSASGIADVEACATVYVNDHYRQLEQAIVGPFFFGGDPGLIDLYIWMLMQWHGDPDWMTAHCPKCRALVERVMNLPAIAPVHVATFGPGIGLTSD